MTRTPSATHRNDLSTPGTPGRILPVRASHVSLTSGILFLALLAAGTVVGGIFVTDPITTPRDQMTAVGTLHGLGAGLALVLPLAALLINLGLTRDSRFAGVGRLLRCTAAIPAVALVMFMTAQALLAGDDSFGPDTPIGWQERILVLLYATWQIAVAMIVRRRTRR